MKFLYIIFVLIMGLNSLAQAQSDGWSATEAEEVINLEGSVSITATTLKFTHPKKEGFVFKPNIAPYTLADLKTVVLENTTFFITGWAYGAATTQFKIFNPSVSQLPLCQEISEGEDAELRIKNKMLEIKIYKISAKSKQTESWVRCTDRFISSQVVKK